jgi:hypothetical protein
MTRIRKDWREIAAAWEQSGERQEAFAARRGVSVHALRYWVYKRRGEKPASRMVEVRVSPPTSSAHLVEIGFPQGLRMRLAVGTEIAWTSALVKSLLG